MLCLCYLFQWFGGLKTTVGAILLCLVRTVPVFVSFARAHFISLVLCHCACSPCNKDHLRLLPLSKATSKIGGGHAKVCTITNYCQFCVFVLGAQILICLLSLSFFLFLHTFRVCLKYKFTLTWGKQWWWDAFDVEQHSTFVFENHLFCMDSGTLCLTICCSHGIACHCKHVQHTASSLWQCGRQACRHCVIVCIATPCLGGVIRLFLGELKK